MTRLTHCLLAFALMIPAACTKEPGASVSASTTPVSEARHEGCTGEHAPAPGAAEAKPVADESGKQILTAGMPLTGAPLVSVADLVARPEELAGTVVRLEGNVSAMCHHARSWLALQAPDRSGAFVRVVTTPAFLVPEGAMGMKVLAEGTVELVDVAPGAAKHYAQDHQLGDPTAVGEAPVRSVRLRATGAQFQ